MYNLLESTKALKKARRVVTVPAPIRKPQYNGIEDLPHFPQAEVAAAPDVVPVRPDIRAQIEAVVQGMLPAILNAMETAILETVDRRIESASFMAPPSPINAAPVNYQMKIIRDADGKIATVNCEAKELNNE